MTIAIFGVSIRYNRRLRHVTICEAWSEIVLRSYTPSRVGTRTRSLVTFLLKTWREISTSAEQICSDRNFKPGHGSETYS